MTICYVYIPPVIKIVWWPKNEIKWEKWNVELLPLKLIVVHETLQFWLKRVSYRILVSVQLDVQASWRGRAFNTWRVSQALQVASTRTVLLYEHLHSSDRSWNRGKAQTSIWSRLASIWSRLLKPPGATLRYCTDVILIVSIQVTIRKTGFFNWNAIWGLEERTAVGLLFPFLVCVGGGVGQGIKFCCHSPGSLVDTRKEKVSGKGLEPPGFPEELQVRRNSFGTVLEAWLNQSGPSPLSEGLVNCHTSAQGAAALTWRKSPYL